MTEAVALFRILLVAIPALAFGFGMLIYAHLTRDRALPPAE